LEKSDSDEILRAGCQDVVVGRELKLSDLEKEAQCVRGGLEAIKFKEPEWSAFLIPPS